MFCPKCGKELHNDSLFCSGCGYRLVEENIPKKEPVFVEPPMPVPTVQYVPYVAAAPEKKKTPILLIVGLIISIIACIFAFVYALALQSQNNQYSQIIEDSQLKMGQLERETTAAESELADVKAELENAMAEIEAIAAERDEYIEVADLFWDLLDYIKEAENLGYSTENFHANKGIVVIDRMGGTQELKIFSTYYTNFSLEVSDTDVFIAKWTDKEWTGKETQIYITPVDYGVGLITISNELYNNAFDILVIVI